MKLFIRLTVLACFLQELRADISEVSDTDRHYLPPDDSSKAASSRFSSVHSSKLTSRLGENNYFQKDHRHQNHEHRSKDDYQQQLIHHHQQHDHRQNHKDNQEKYEYQKKVDHRQRNNHKDQKNESKESNSKLSFSKDFSGRPNVGRRTQGILFDDIQVKNAGVARNTKKNSEEKTSKFQHSSVSSSRDQTRKSAIRRNNDQNDHSNNYKSVSRTKPASVRLTSTPTVSIKGQQNPKSNPKSEYHKSSPFSQPHARNRDEQALLGSSQAPEVIYKPGDDNSFAHVTLFDVLNREESGYSRSRINTEKLADGYHYATPKNRFFN